MNNFLLSLFVFIVPLGNPLKTNPDFIKIFREGGTQLLNFFASFLCQLINSTFTFKGKNSYQVTAIFLNFGFFKTKLYLDILLFLAKQVTATQRTVATKNFIFLQSEAFYSPVVLKGAKSVYL